MRFLFVVAMILLAPSFVVAQPAPTDHPSAMVFRNGFPETIKITAERSEKVTTSSFKDRKEAAQQVVNARDMLLIALDTPNSEELFLTHQNFLLALSNAFALDEEMRLWNGAVVLKYFTWRRQVPLDAKTEQVFAQWFGAVTQSYFTPPADTTALIIRCKKRLKNLMLAEIDIKKRKEKLSDKKADQQRGSIHTKRISR